MSTPTLLICGATGTLGQAFARACRRRGIGHRLIGRDVLDLERPDAIGATLDEIRPWAVVNAAGWVRVDEAEANEAACHAVNATGAIALAQHCADRGIASLNFSSHLVFDGCADRPYVESDRPNPLNAYGRSKAAMEEGCTALPGALTVRTAAFYSAQDRCNFAVAVVDALSNGRRFRAADDHVVSPTFVPALVDAALDLLIDGTEGLCHLAGADPVSWAIFARRVAEAVGLDEKLIDGVPGASLGWTAARPLQVALASERCAVLGSLDERTKSFADDLNRTCANLRAA